MMSSSPHVSMRVTLTTLILLRPLMMPLKLMSRV